MPDHRFIEELSLWEENRLNGHYEILVVGTFNAGDQPGPINDAPWYYGRYRNEFWYLFPQLLGADSLHRRELIHLPLDEVAQTWRQFCIDNRVIIIDVYKSIGGDLPNHGDAAIEDPEIYEPFDYQRAFENCYFDKVLFTWKGRNAANTLGILKESMHTWFQDRGSTNLHMVSPSYSYRRTRQNKLASWLQAYNNI